jgi:hypothetical protein
MAGKRVLIASQVPLFDGGLSAILLNNPRVEVVGVCRGDANELERQAQDLEADVILVIDQPAQILSNFKRLLEEITPCLIKVQTTDNSIHIYHRQVVHEGELDDIVTAVLADC